MDADGSPGRRLVALGLPVGQRKKIERIAQGLGEAIQPCRVGFELTQPVGAGKRHGLDEVETLLGDGDEPGAPVASYSVKPG